MQPQPLPPRRPRDAAPEGSQFAYHPTEPKNPTDRMERSPATAVIKSTSPAGIRTRHSLASSILTEAAESSRTGTKAGRGERPSSTGLASRPVRAAVRTPSFLRQRQRDAVEVHSAMEKSRTVRPAVSKRARRSHDTGHFALSALRPMRYPLGTRLKRACVEPVSYPRSQGRQPRTVTIQQRRAAPAGLPRRTAKIEKLSARPTMNPSFLRPLRWWRKETRDVAGRHLT
jgi:hypothetical protein